MKNLFGRFGAVVGLVGVLVLGGCGEVSKEVKLSGVVVDEFADGQGVKIGIPFSEGPSEAPNVNGPDSPAPVVEAVTEVENIKLTLPVKTQ